MRKIQVSDGTPFAEPERALVLNKLLATQYLPRRKPGYISPSMVTSCLRRQVMAFLGIPARPMNFTEVRFAEAGTEMHSRYHILLANALEQGRIDELHTEVPMVDEELHLQGTADALVRIENTWYLCECKSISPWVKDLGYYETKWSEQVHCYIHLARSAGYPVNEGYIHVVRRGEEEFVGEYVVYWNDTVWEAVRGRISLVVELAQQHLLPAVMECPCGPEAKIVCEYDTICGDWTEPRVVEDNDG